MLLLMVSFVFCQSPFNVEKFSRILQTASSGFEYASVNVVVVTAEQISRLDVDKFSRILQTAS